MLRTCLRLRPLATRLRQAPAKRRFGIANMLPDMLTHLPAPSDPMFAVLCLSGAQVVMGAFGQSVMHACIPSILFLTDFATNVPATHMLDNFYHHEFTERLPWSPTAVEEEHIHAIR